MLTLPNSPIKLNILCSRSTKGGTIFTQRGLNCENMELHVNLASNTFQIKNESFN